MLFTTKTHRFFFLLGLALSLCALPYSPFALSVGLITLAVNWLLGGFWVDKINRFINRKTLWAFLLVYLSIIIGFFYSDNINYALKELRLWLPLLFIPVILTTSEPLKREEFKFLLLMFCLSVFVATIISFSIYLREFSIGSQNVRAISPYVSHIRLSLMILFSIFILSYSTFTNKFLSSYLVKSILFIVTLWFITFLFILQSITGIAILGIVSLFLAIRWISSVKDIVLKFCIIVGLSLLVLVGVSYLTHTVDRYFTRNKVDFKNLPKTTPNGNLYTQDTISKQYENGNLVWINICYPELKREWNRVSKFSFDSKDADGQRVELTLIRYLTSKGIRKDSVGIAQLDSIDVQLIERGVASIIYRDHKIGIYPRFYQIMWEIDSYLTRGLVGGSSLVQRYVFFKASWHVIKNHFLFGVGTGDGADFLNEYYRSSGINLEPEYWAISHNEFLTIWIASGLFGLFLFLVGLFYPFFSEKKYKIFLCLVFQIIVVASMLNEDTFETHIGVSFAALFYSILFFSYDFNDNKQE
ncbi:MAG: O-antigen ligase family protein [Bacteroidales bacterium]|nr:O-antigen ligase family protein [Bacteroidales bacterium]